MIASTLNSRANAAVSRNHNGNSPRIPSTPSCRSRYVRTSVRNKSPYATRVTPRARAGASAAVMSLQLFQQLRAGVGEGSLAALVEQIGTEPLEI